ncbi:MAG TPA: glycosyltransferase family 4 protein [Rhodocyclaceae bacterium]|nr:glycosyltransferase family 4 protein [Rhodocyclaceae bacterium]
MHTDRARRLRILTWHVHGNYLYYLTHVPHDFYIVTRRGNPPGYAGKIGQLPWPDNVHEVTETAVRDGQFDCILFQSRQHYLEDRQSALSAAQRALPTIFLEHDPPQQHPTDTKHFVQDANTLLVHVTHFNALMWDNGITPVDVVEHGVVVPHDVRYSGELERGIVVVNNMGRRGRRLGADVFMRLRASVPLDLAGMNAQDMNGVGEIGNLELAAFSARYRFFFNPIRYTSLGLAILEAMMIGMPIVGLATTELVSVIRNGENGYLSNRLPELADVMHRLIADPAMAKAWGEGARRVALKRFNIDRFVSDWLRVFARVTE